MTLKRESGYVPGRSFTETRINKENEENVACGVP